MGAWVGGKGLYLRLGFFWSSVRLLHFVCSTSLFSCPCLLLISVQVCRIIESGHGSSDDGLTMLSILIVA